jgi:broad specificity phosphatase PhoE
VTVFLLIRHAEKDAPDDLLTGRSPDIPLSARGRIQAERLAQRLHGEPIDRILSSPIQRARETAAVLARPKQLDVQIAEAITEFDFGQWTGLAPSSLKDDPRWRAFNEFRSATSTPRGETMLNVQARFVAEMLRIHESFPNARVALVSHGDPIRAAVAHFAGIPIDLASRLEISLASVSAIALHERSATVLKINETGHL